MQTVLFIPPLSRMSGGLATLYVLAKTLHQNGFSVRLTTTGSKTPGFEEAKQQGIPCSQLADIKLNASDIWLIPESWPNMLVYGAQAGAHTIVYAQSWQYLITTLPAGVQWKNLPVTFIAASTPIAWLLSTMLGIECSYVLPPPINPLFFREETRPTSHIRIAFMPRKNNHLTRQIQDITRLYLQRCLHTPAVEWVSIHQQPHEQVAGMMGSAHLYLTTSFPEGFGLPAAEAMACGTIPIGFTGFGGWEYMQQNTLPPISSIPEVTAYMPPPGLPKNSYLPNGWFTADGDTLQTALVLSKAILAITSYPEIWHATSQAARATALHYTYKCHEQRTIRLWRELENPIKTHRSV